jgi:hypothetical protein
MLRLKFCNQFWRIDGREGREASNCQFTFYQRSGVSRFPLKIRAMGNKAAGFV